MQKSSLDFELSDTDTSIREGTAISNLDGRLWAEVGAIVGSYFGEEALVRGRVGIESRYLIALSEVGVIRKFTKKEKETLANLHRQITPGVYKELRKIEFQTRHDVVAMTLLFKSLLKKVKTLDDVIGHGWVHWGLTSEDVDNLARTILINNFVSRIYIEEYKNILKVIIEIAKKTGSVTIPGKTHLQTAIPTTFGKEIALYGVRLAESLQKIKNLRLRGKLTGAVGNLSAHRLAFPGINWRRFSERFVAGCGLEPNLFTTQIESKSRLIELFSLIQNANSILIDMSQDMRIYCGFDWLRQTAKSNEFGSSAMPQKVNPIDFENSQGNALLSNWILEGLNRQLPISWLQRDLVDKTIFRNLGLPFGYSLIAFISAQKGLGRISVNKAKIDSELDADWGMLAEAFQIKLRSIGEGKAYDDLKNATRGKETGKEEVLKWIEGLKVSPKIKNELCNINHSNYLGYAKENAKDMIRLIRKILLVV